MDDFETVEQLVHTLLQLNQSNEKYNEYLEYKRSGVTNDNLKRIMENREWGVNNWDRLDFISGFECHICHRLHENMKKYGNQSYSHHASLNHYGCPRPKRFSDEPPGNLERRDDLWWAQEWDYSRYLALALQELINKGQTFSEKDVHNRAYVLRYKQEY